MRDWLDKGLIFGAGAAVIAACGGSDDSGAFYGYPDGGAGAAGASAGSGGSNQDGGAGSAGTGATGGTGAVGGSGGVAGGSCTSDQGCTAGVCDPLMETCVECLLDIDCGDGRRCRDNACETIVECANSLDCVPTPKLPICDTLTGTCEECVAAADCDGDAECVDHRCEPYTPCVNSLDCAAGGQVCDTLAGKCVECLAQADCSTEQECVGNSCVNVVSCQSDNHCTPMGMLCDTTRGVCVQCLRHVDCPDVYHCAANACVLDVCRQGEAQCQANAVRECNAVGDGFITSPCGSRQSCVQSGGAATCEDWVCTAGQTYCDGQMAIECSSDGLTILGSTDCDAQNLTCSAGQCKDQLCTPDEFYCDGNQVMECNSTGTSASVWDTCTSSEYCNQATAFCVDQVCTPNQAACNGDVATTCNAQGSGYAPGGTDCSQIGQSCFNGSCQSCPGGAGAVDALRLTELFTEEDPGDYVVLKNTSTSCPADLAGLVMHFGNASCTNSDFTLSTRVLTPGESVFIVDSGNAQTGDIEAPSAICMIPDAGGQVLVCNGTCSSSTVIDALVYTGSGTTSPTPPALPSGVTFTPSPISGVTTSNESTTAYVRVAFAGSSPGFLRSDWGTGSPTRPSNSGCPATQPSDGSGCSQFFQSCTYGSVTCTCTTTWSCQ